MLEKIKHFVRENRFLLSILGGVIFGAAAGIVLRFYDVGEDTRLIISYPGELFLRSLKLIVLPFLICCLIVGSATLHIQKNKKIAILTLILFVCLCVLHVIIGIMFAVIICPGNSSLIDRTHHGNSAQFVKTSILDGFLDTGRNIIPDNLFQATFQQTFTQISESNVNGSSTVNKKITYRDGMNTIGVIFISLVFGSVLGTLPSRGGPVLLFFSTSYTVLEKILYAIVKITPLGVASIICSKLITVPNLLLTLTQLSYFVIETIASFIFCQLIVIQIIYFMIIRKNPYKYYCQLSPIIATAFATATKAAALPVTFQVLNEKIKMNKKITNFILPLGTINMNGTAVYIPQAVIFLAQLNNSNLQFSDYLTIGLGCIASSFSVASVPSYAIVLVTMLCSTVNVPIENVGLILAVDWFVDRFRTTNNVLGDCYSVAVIQHLCENPLQGDQNEKLEMKENEENLINDDCDV